MRSFECAPPFGMNEARSYPIPESEVHKLDELQEHLPHDVEGMVRRSDQWIRSNPLAATLIAALAGFMIAQRLRR